MSTAAADSMKVTRTDLNACTIQLEVVCSPWQVQTGFERALKAFAKQIRVPGFRPGSAPRTMVEGMVPAEDLANAAAEEIVKVSLKKAMDDESVRPEGVPNVNVTKFDKESSACEFTVKIPLAPKVQLGDYKGLEANRQPVDVTDDEVQRQVDDLRTRKGKREQVVDRGVQSGDMAVVNIKVAGETGDGRNFMIVVGQTFPALDETMVGMASEEIKHSKLKFPENFQEADWAGKTHECTVTLRSVSTVVVPDLDDDFAKALKADNVKDLKEKVRDGILRAKEQIGQEMVNEQLLDRLLSSSQVEVADNTWEAVGNRRLQETHRELVQNGSTLEDHAKQNGMSLDELVEAQMAEAKLHVQRAVLIEHIFRAEKMNIKDDEANAIALQIASENGVPQEELGSFFKKYGQQIREEVVYRAMYAKVVGFLNENANITEGSTPAAKPRAAKKKKDE